jgi:thioredoxin 2
MSNTTTDRRATVSCPFCDTLNRVDLARLDAGPKCGGCSRPLRLDRPQRIGGAALERIVADAGVPVLVDFYADWCGPCRIMAPVLDELAHDRAGELLVCKVDTDRHTAAASRYGIRGIPTVIAFSGGREVGRQVGVVPRAALEGLLARPGGPTSKVG